jgi:glucosamine-6-phosphate deaminase
MNTKFYETSGDACKDIATEIKELIARKNAEGKKCVLGLTTGNTPVGVYKELIKMFNKGEVSFKNVVTFNIGEYYPISHSNP